MYILIRVLTKQVVLYVLTRVLIKQFVLYVLTRVLTKQVVLYVLTRVLTKQVVLYIQHTHTAGPGTEHLGVCGPKISSRVHSECSCE